MRIKNGCCIYIKFGSKKIKLPVNPEELEIEYPTNHQTYDVLGKGYCSQETVAAGGILGIFFPGP